MGALAKAATVRIGRRSFPFTTCEHVSAAYRATIERMGLGSSRAPPCLIFDSEGRNVGYVSYNGRVWPFPPDQWETGRASAYNPPGWKGV